MEVAHSGYCIVLQFLHHHLKHAPCDRVSLFCHDLWCSISLFHIMSSVHQNKILFLLFLEERVSHKSWAWTYSTSSVSLKRTADTSSTEFIRPIKCLTCCYLKRADVFLRSFNCWLQCWEGSPSSIAPLSADETLCSLFVRRSKAINWTCSSFSCECIAVYDHEPRQTNCSHHCFHCFDIFFKCSAYFKGSRAIFLFQPSVLDPNYKLWNSTQLHAH